VTLEHKLGESLIRTMIDELAERVIALERQQESGSIGKRVAHYRLRWIRNDYNKLVTLARRYGFKVS